MVNTSGGLRRPRPDSCAGHGGIRPTPDSSQQRPARGGSEPYRASLRASIPRAVVLRGQFRQGGTSFFWERSCSLLAAPPTGAPLRGRGAVGSSLKGIPPTVPSPRSAPRLGTREQFRSLKTKKEPNALQIRTDRPANQERPGPKLPVKTFRLGRIKAAVWENESDSKKFYNVTFARTYGTRPRTITTPTASGVTTSRSSPSWPTRPTRSSSNGSPPRTNDRDRGRGRLRAAAISMPGIREETRVKFAFAHRRPARLGKWSCPCRVFQLYRRVKVVPLRGLHLAPLRFPLVGLRPSSALRSAVTPPVGKTASIGPAANDAFAFCEGGEPPSDIPMRIYEMKMTYHLIQEGPVEALTNAARVVEYMRGGFEELPFVECLYVIPLNRKNRPLGRIA